MKNILINSWQYFYQSNKHRIDRTKARVVIQITLISFYLILFAGIMIFLYTTYIAGLTNNVKARPIFDTVNLTIFGTLLLNLGFSAITGIYHPFFISDVELSLMQRHYIEPDVLRFSTFFTNLLKSSLLILFMYGTYLPILIIGRLPILNYLVSFVILILTMITLILIIDIIFYSTRRIRKQINSVGFITDGPLWMGLFYIGPTVLGFIAISEDYMPDLAGNTIYQYIPIVNNVVAFSGFYLRAGVPYESLIALLAIIVQIPILLIIYLGISRNYPLYDDLGASAIKFNTMKSFRTELQQLDEEGLEYRKDIKGTDFEFKSSIVSIMTNDYLAIRRTKSGDTWSYQSILVVPLALVGLSFDLPPIIRTLIAFILIYLATNLSRLLIMIETPTLFDQIAVNSFTYRTVKLLDLILLNLVILSPLVLLSPFIFLPAVLFAIIVFLLSDVSILRTRYGRIGLLYLYFLLTAYFILPSNMRF